MITEESRPGGKKESFKTILYENCHFTFRLPADGIMCNKTTRKYNVYGD